MEMEISKNQYWYLGSESGNISKKWVFSEEKEMIGKIKELIRAKTSPEDLNPQKIEFEEKSMKLIPISWQKILPELLGGN